MPTRPPVFRPLGRSREAQTRVDKRAVDERRGSSARRGYGYDWQQLRLQQLADEPLCRFCAECGLVVAATVVDHIVPIVEAPARRLDRSNLRSLCKSCHDAHTARTQGFARTRRPGGGG